MSHEIGDKVFIFDSAISLSHTFIHNLNTISPDVVTIDDVTSNYIIPDNILVIDGNTVQVTFFVARAIRGKIQ